MRRILLASLLMVLAGISALAQQPQPPQRPMPAMPRAPKAGEAKPPTIQQRLRYICKHLDLNEQQWQQVEALFEALEAEANPSPDELQRQVDLIQATAQDMTAAKEKGDTQLADELRQKLLDLSPERIAERNFFAGLTPTLTPEQKAKLEVLRKRVEEVKDARELSLKPIQVLQIARGFKLSAVQLERLDELQRSFRKDINSGGEDDARRTELLNKLISDVGATLSAEQRAEFQKQVDNLRLDVNQPPLKRALPASPPQGNP
jgi:Spy/CpxP family protein refolding chaperone